MTIGDIETAVDGRDVAWMHRRRCWRGSVLWFAAAPGALELVGGLGEDGTTECPDVASPGVLRLPRR
jgi:hypothetical protein